MLSTGQGRPMGGAGVKGKNVFGYGIRAGKSPARGPARVARALFIALGFLFCPPAIFAYSLVLAWDPNAETDLAGYNLYYGTVSRQYSEVRHVGMTNVFTVTNLVPGVTYYFSVTAFNTSGLESDFSNEVSYEAPGPQVVKVFPILTTRSRGLLLAWQSNPGGVYRVFYKNSLADLFWSETGSDIVASSKWTALTVDTSSGGPARFYKVELVR